LNDLNNLNSVLLEGNLVRDAELNATTNGSSVCNFTVASNRYFRHGDDVEKEVNFFDVVVWGEKAKPCSEQGFKGRSVRIVGRLKQDRWDSIDGKNHSKVKIVAEHVEFRPFTKKKVEEVGGSLSANPEPIEE